MGPSTAGTGAVDVTPDGSTVYASNGFINTVSVISTAPDTVVATISLPQPGDIAMAPDGTRAYIATLNGVAVVSTAANSVLTTMPVPGTGAVAMNPNGATLYATGRYGGTDGVIPIATSTNTVGATIPLVGGQDVAVGPSGKVVYALALSSPVPTAPLATILISGPSTKVKASKIAISNGSATMTATVTVPATATTGAYRVKVSDPGGNSVTCASCLSVIAPRP